jgi:hypothetical protein
MPQQLSQVPIDRVGYPDPRETVFHHQPQQQLRILTIGLLLPYPLALNFGGVSDPQLKPQFLQQPLKPARVSTGFHPRSHGLILLFQFPVKLLRFVPMPEPSFSQFTCVRV